MDLITPQNVLEEHQDSELLPPWSLQVQEMDLLYSSCTERSVPCHPSSDQTFSPLYLVIVFALKTIFDALNYIFGSLF